MATDIKGANLTDGGSFIDLMKRLQPQREIERIWQLRYPLLGSVSKADDFEGTQIDVPLEHSNPSASRTFADAQGDNRHPSSSKKYSLVRKRDYGTGVIDAETMHASRSNKGSWLRALQRETGNVLLTLEKRSAIGMYRNHGGAIGVTGAVANGDGILDRITLTNKSDVINFQIGQCIQLAATDGTSGSVLAGVVYVGKRDFDNGYLYCVASPGGAAADLSSVISGGEVAGKYIFNKGDFGQSFHGLDSWIPLTAPASGENFLGIDRSEDPMLLSGHRINDTSMSYEELVQELAARITYSGGMNLTCYMAPMQVKQFALELDTKVVRDPGGIGRTGFRGVVVDTVAGPVSVIGDPACPEDRMYMLDLSTFKFHHLKAFPHLVEDDGLARLRVADADQISFRYRLWGNLGCTAPGKNGVAALPVAF